MVAWVILQVTQDGAKQDSFVSPLIVTRTLTLTLTLTLTHTLTLTLTLTLPLTSYLLPHTSCSFFLMRWYDQRLIFKLLFSDSYSFSEIGL